MGLRQHRIAAGRQIDIQTRGIGRHVIGIDAAAIPDCHEDAVAAGSDRGQAVDHRVTVAGGPGIRCVARVGGEVGAIYVLQRRDIVHHIGLGITILFVGIARRWPPDVRPIGHHGVFHAIQIRRHCTVDAGILAVFQAQSMAYFVQHRVPVVVAHHRRTARPTEERITARHAIVRVIGVSRARVRCVRQTECASAIRASVSDVQVGETLDREPCSPCRLCVLKVVEREVHRHNLLGVKVLEVGECLGVPGLILVGRSRIAIGD